jgi:predicted ATP-binding protein involved in virulence
LFLGESNFERDIVVNKIKEMNGFLSLGIDRQFKYKEINHFFDGNPKKLENLSNLDISLYDVKKKINLEFRRFNAIQSKLGENFKAQILKDSFTFIDDVSFFGSDIEMEPFLKQIEQQEVEFNSIIETYKMKDLTENCKKFFFELKNVVNKLIKWEKGPQKGMEADFLKQILLFGVNRSMLNKINRIVDMGKKNAEAILRSKDRITRFLDATNIFLSETGKRISINSLGEVLIHLPNGQKGNILDLSSGEKHLLIIFSYLIFNENTSSVFVVDEPELSLHIAWQEIFVDTVQKANPNAQLIFATHSPSIIAHKERQKYCIDLAKRN